MNQGKLPCLILVGAVILNRCWTSVGVENILASLQALISVAEAGLICCFERFVKHSTSNIIQTRSSACVDFHVEALLLRRGVLGLEKSCVLTKKIELIRKTGKVIICHLLCDV